MNTYKVNFSVAVSNVATLSDLTVDGVTVTGFDPEVLTYDVVLPKGTTTVPTVAATPTDPNATVVVNGAAALPGNTTVVSTAENRTTILTYTIRFTLDATGISDYRSAGITVYPSVSRDFFVVKTPGGKSIISLYSLTGSLVSRVVSLESETLVSAPGPGLYLLRVENNEETGTFRIIQTK
jgi:hypothetical protein